MKALFLMGLALSALFGGSVNAADLTRPVLVTPAGCRRRYCIRRWEGDTTTAGGYRSHRNHKQRQCR
jgi:hypothetical protein